MLSPQDAERLSRYAAGELDAAERRSLEAELASRPELKQALERLLRLDALVAMTELEDEALSRRVLAQLPPARRTRRWPVMLAAAAVLLAVAGAALMLRGEEVVPVPEHLALEGISASEGSAWSVTGERALKLEHGTVLVELPVQVTGPNGERVAVDEPSVVTTEPENAALHVSRLNPEVRGAHMTNPMWKTVGALSILSLTAAAAPPSKSSAPPQQQQQAAAAEPKGDGCQCEAPMRELAPKLIDCYRSALKTTPKLSGKGLVRITTTAEGKAIDARLTGDDAEANPLYAQCIASAALTAKFGPYEGEERRQFTWGLSIVPDGAVGYRLGELDEQKFQAQAKAKQPQVDGSPTLGSADAKVTMVVFTNAECKFCQKHHPTLLRLRRAYGDKVRFVFKQVPMDSEEFSESAALAIFAANEQGRFSEYVDALYAQPMPDEATLLATAKKVGLEVKRFNEVRASPAAAAQLERDRKAAKEADIGGVPSAVINGQRITGAYPYEKFVELLEAELKK